MKNGEKAQAEALRENSYAERQEQGTHRKLKCGNANSLHKSFSEILLELDEDSTGENSDNLSAKEIAEELDESGYHDAVDIISELPEEIKEEGLSRPEKYYKNKPRS
ncbi:hypothetical protein FQA39_LY19376 [Lamprigera yunnana]|nr:hypothetical protein FQA39_LY19376 [Lamprigera yunnana]